jgi:hypothetical protein
MFNQSFMLVEKKIQRFNHNLIKNLNIIRKWITIQIHGLIKTVLLKTEQLTRAH